MIAHASKGKHDTAPVDSLYFTGGEHNLVLFMLGLVGLLLLNAKSFRIM
jgi:hypothetical protein